jgi:hypothetical protein
LSLSSASRISAHRLTACLLLGMTSSVALPALADTNPHWLTLLPDVQYIIEP